MMGGKRGRAAASSANPERVRTHLFFSQQPERQHQKRKRRAQNKLHQVTHKKDEMVQVGEIDPSQWTGVLLGGANGIGSVIASRTFVDVPHWFGNQRVLHFGPMARRDPYFYYYPKGWDILYPAHFGFFPYRTTKFRGSSSLICMCAFGCFLVLGGCLMVLMGYYVVHDTPFWTWQGDRKYRPPPIQIAGPALFATGALLLLISLVYSIATSNICQLHLFSTKKQSQPSKLTTITTYYSSPPAVFEKHPYQPLPPPAYPVLENRYAQSSLVRPHDEMKLYPPVIPGCSTLSLHGKSPSSVFVASPYNTLRASSVARYHSGVLEGASGIMENRRTGSIVSRRQSSEASYKRSKSMGPLHRTGSNRSSRSRMRDREDSQI